MKRLDRKYHNVFLSFHDTQICTAIYLPADFRCFLRTEQKTGPKLKCLQKNVLESFVALKKLYFHRIMIADCQSLSVVEP